MNKTKLNMVASAADAALISKIAERAHAAWQGTRGYKHLTKLDVEMDLTAVHLNGCPLRLEELLQAPAGSFAHDLLGIHRLLNRNTGQLGDFFLPRYAQSEKVA